MHTLVLITISILVACQGLGNNVIFLAYRPA